MDIAQILTIAGGLAALLTTYKSLDSRIDAAIEARLGAKMAPLLSAAKAAELPLRMRREMQIMVLGIPGPSREKTADYLRTLGWQRVLEQDTPTSSPTPTFQVALAESAVVVLDRATDLEGAALADHLRLRANVQNPTDAATWPPVIWFCPADHQAGRCDMRPLGDAGVAANSRAQVAHWVAVRAELVAWARRAVA